MTTRFRQPDFVRIADWGGRSAASLLLIAAIGQAGAAQIVGANTTTGNSAKSVIPPVPNTLFVEDRTYSLFDGLVREMRNGGFVIYMRHGPTLVGTMDKRGAGAWWRDCDKSQRLAPEALPRSSAIGRSMASQRIPVGEVLTSEFCRAYETGAQLGLAAPIRTPLLNDLRAISGTNQVPMVVTNIQELISRPISGKTNRLLVGHPLPTDAGLHPALSQLSESQTAIFKLESSGQFHHVATLSPGQWQWIAKQAVADTIAPQIAAVPSPAPPLIDPAKELKGTQLLQALRRGGYNLYMRHAQSNVGQDANLAQTPAWWENCSIQRNISDPGREQARKVGAAIRELAVPVSQVVAAQFCRTRDTAHLMGLGPIEVSEDLNHQIGQRAGFDVNTARFKRLATSPASGMNNVLVSHTHGSPRMEERIMGGLQEAEIVVYRPDGNGGTEPIARIPLAEWDNLGKLQATGTP